MPIKLLTPEEAKKAREAERLAERVFRTQAAQAAHSKSDKAKRDKAGPIPELVKAAWLASGLTGASCFLKAKLRPKLRDLLREAGVQAERVAGNKYRFYMKEPQHEWTLAISSLKSDYFARKGSWAQETESQID